MERKLVLRPDVSAALDELGLGTGEDFAQIGEAFEREHRVSRTICGSAGLRLMRQRELVDFAVAWIEANRR